MFELPRSFPHHPPKGYSYAVSEFKAGYLGIWIGNHFPFSYTKDSPVYAIWGMYNVKTQKYYAPKNSKMVGKEVDIAKTTPYTAMQQLKSMRPSVLAFI